MIRFNVPRLLDRGGFDEIGLRMQIRNVRKTGFCSLNTGLIPGMAGWECRSMTRRGGLLRP